MKIDGGAKKGRAILLTGSTGRIGRQLLNRLEEVGYRVVKVDIGYKKLNQNIEELLEIKHKGEEVRDLGNLTLIHCAASTPDNTTEKSMIYPINLAINRSLAKFIEKNKNIDSIINMSSMSAFGKIDEEVVSEKTLPKISDGYGLSKLHGEGLIRSLAMEQNKQLYTIRLPGVICEGMTGNFIARLISSVKNELTFKANNVSNYFNNIVSSSSLSEFCTRLIERHVIENNKGDEEVFVLGASSPMTIEEIVNQVCDHYQRSDAEIYMDRTSESKSFIIDNTKAIEFGYTTRTTREELNHCLLEFDGK
tara:strand:+ start:2265 stop:3185 length:921 start_codon:yes stop_codon:yes gene_type:complete